MKNHCQIFLVCEHFLISSVLSRKKIQFEDYPDFYLIICNHCMYVCVCVCVSFLNIAVTENSLNV